MCTNQECVYVHTYVHSSLTAWLFTALLPCQVRPAQSRPAVEGLWGAGDHQDQCNGVPLAVELRRVLQPISAPPRVGPGPAGGNKGDEYKDLEHVHISELVPSLP